MAEAAETVEIAIGGRRFRLQCGPGEAPRVHQLARLMDEVAARLIQGQPGMGEEKLLLLTSLMLADRLDEALAEREQIAAELGRLGDQVRERARWAMGTAARRLDALAAHIERAAEG